MTSATLNGQVSATDVLKLVGMAFIPNCVVWYDTRTKKFRFKFWLGGQKFVGEFDTNLIDVKLTEFNGVNPIVFFNSVGERPMLSLELAKKPTGEIIISSIELAEEPTGEPTGEIIID